MATFTMYFKDVLEAEPEIKTKILAQYPIFSESYRERLNELITDRYWNREIGQETPSMFMLALKRKLNEIMPTYNEHYKTSLIAAGVDPLQTMSMENESGGKSKTESTGTSVSDSESKAASRAVASEFPQTTLSDDGDYASGSQDSTSGTTAKSKGDESGSTVQDSINTGTVKGSQGQTSMLLLQHRQTLVNVDLMVLNELEELFFGLWAAPDDFTIEGTRGYGIGFGYGNIFGGFW